MINKKSQISTTLTWFVGIIIIFFIIILFITASIVLAGQKKVSNIKVLGISGEEDRYSFESLRVQRSLSSFLNSQVRISDTPKEIEDLILESLDPYLKVDSINSLQDMNNLANVRAQLGKEFFSANQLELKDEILFKKSQEVLNNFCSEYMLRVPQGIVFSGKTDFVLDSEFESSGWKEILISDWTPWAEIQLPYKDKMIKIKFKELKQC
jgi:hypothetical protein